MQNWLGPLRCYRKKITRAVIGQIYGKFKGRNSYQNLAWFGVKCKKNETKVKAWTDGKMDDIQTNRQSDRPMEGWSGVNVSDLIISQNQPLPMTITGLSYIIDI